MKVLVTNNTIRDLGGSETYAYAVIKELHRRPDIEVTGYSRALGYLSNLLRLDGVNIINKVELDYDLVLASHTSTIPAIFNVTGTKIQTCHGIYPALEQPHRMVDKHVSISNEVKVHLSNKGFASEIIHNGIDCERFSPIKPLNKKLKNILSLSQSSDLNILLQKVCDSLGLNLVTLNKFKNPIFNVETEINNADLVISLGRGVYESMACGRNVLILDKRPYIPKPPLGDGLITDKNIDDFILNNCSGRFTNTVFSEQNIIDEIMKYDYRLGEFTREYALKNLNIITQMDKYLNLNK